MYKIALIVTTVFLSFTMLALSFKPETHIDVKRSTDVYKEVGKTLGSSDATLIYIIDENDVRIIQEVFPSNQLNAYHLRKASQAMVNETLISLLKQGYYIESTQRVPVDNAGNEKLCIGLMKEQASH